MKTRATIYLNKLEYDALLVRAEQLKTSASDLARLYINRGLNERLEVIQQPPRSLSRTVEEDV